MILQGKNTDILEESSSMSSSKMQIDEESVNFMMQMVSKFYADSVGSPIRETVSNAWDSHINAGVTKPIIVKLSSNAKTGNWEFSVRDEGLGIDTELVENVIKKYGKSTKRNDNNCLGAFGLGFKSPMSYTPAFYFTGWKDGIERKWIMREGDDGNKVDLLYEKESDLPTGAEIIIPITNWDRGDFSRKIREQLCYFSNVFVIDEYSEFDNNFKIFQTDDFKWSEVCPSREMHLCLADVYYPIDWAKLGISRINIPIGLKFGLGEGIEPLPARESFKYNQTAKDAILVKIEKVADYFVNKYNEQVLKFDSLIAAYPHINVHEKSVILEGKQFIFNDVLSFAKIQCNEPVVEGVKLKSPSWYKSNIDHLVWEYNIVGECQWNLVWKNKPRYANLSRDILGKRKLVLVDTTPVGNFKEYLKEKYGTNVKYIQLTNTRILGHSKTTQGYESYRYILGLENVHKSVWRQYIKEFQNLRDAIITEAITEIESLVGNDAFDTWLIKRREDIKAGRIKSSGNYIVLNKKKDVEITVSTARYATYSSTVVFDKATRKIEDLGKSRNMSVYLTKAEITEEVKRELYGYKNVFPELSFIILNDREIKHVIPHHQYKSYKQFMKDTKPFARMASAIKIQNLLNLIPTSRTEYITEHFPKWKDAYNTLKNYVDLHKPERCDMKTQEIILQNAQEFDNFDGVIEGEYINFKKVVDMFYFLPFIIADSQYDTEMTKAAKKKLVTSMIMLQKLKLDDYELVPKIPDEVLEHMHVEATGELECDDCEPLDVFEDEGELVDEDFAEEVI